MNLHDFGPNELIWFAKGHDTSRKGRRSVDILLKQEQMRNFHALMIKKAQDADMMKST